MISKAIKSSFRECLYRGKSVLLLDDLDSIVKNVGEMTPVEEKNHNLLLSHIISEFMEKSRRFLGLVASVKNKDSLHQSLLRSRRTPSSKTFDRIIELNKPNDKERLEILKNNLGDLFSKTLVDMELQIVESTASLTAHDLHRLCVKLDGQDPAKENVLKVIKEAQPMMMSNLSTNKCEGKRWCEIGGLDSLKLKLEETIVWPTKVT